MADRGRCDEKLLFSGDIGNIHQPLINDPEYPESADYVIMESTYGDRSHGPKPDYVPELAKIIQETLDRGGNLVIPSFAVGRTQEMLYFIVKLRQNIWFTATANSRFTWTVRLPLRQPIFSAIIRKSATIPMQLRSLRRALIRFCFRA